MKNKKVRFVMKDEELKILYYRKVPRTSYNINTLHRNLHKANFTYEQKRGLKKALISDNVINVHFCSIY